MQGRAVRSYEERLSAPAWLWAVGGVLVMVLALFFLVALGPVGGLAVVVALGAPMVWGLARSAAPVLLDGDVLTAGSARIPVGLLGPVDVLDAERARAVRGPESDPAAYHLIRGWIPGGIRARVLDPADPTPYWFVASRRPAALAAAIGAAQARAGPGRPGRPG